MHKRKKNSYVGRFGVIGDLQKVQVFSQKLYKTNVACAKIIKRYINKMNHGKTNAQTCLTKMLFVP